MVGPFIFWDQAGPGEFIAGRCLDVLPHPHIGLSTMTYLFSGSLHQRDTLGSDQVITPGAVNMMTAGQGIAHSERTPMNARKQKSDLFGIQCWLALPEGKSEMAPSFEHYANQALPTMTEDGILIKLAAGELGGVKSPVITQSPAVFAECHVEAGKKLSLPANIEERAIYIMNGSLAVDGTSFTATRLLVFKPGVEIILSAEQDSHFIILGGDAMDGPRHIWWNFVATSRERIEQAKQDWKSGKFGKVPGDEEDFVPLPAY